MKYKHKVGEKVEIKTDEAQKEVAIIAKGMEKCRLVYFYNDDDGDTKFFYEHQVVKDKT